MKATFPDGTLFEGTPEEFNAIRGSLGVTQNGHTTSPKATSKGDPQFWNAVNAETFWNSLDPRRGGGNQKKALQFLIKNGGRATYKELKTHMGFEGQRLAGVLANITRNARRETEYAKALAIDWKHDGTGSGFYFIPDDLLTFLKNLK